MSKQTPSATSLAGQKAKQAVQSLCKARERARVAFITAKAEYLRLDAECRQVWRETYDAVRRKEQAGTANEPSYQRGKRDGRMGLSPSGTSSGYPRGYTHGRHDRAMRKLNHLPTSEKWCRE